MSFGVGEFQWVRRSGLMTGSSHLFFLQSKNTMEVIIMAQQNALSRHQFKEIEFNGKDYKFNMQSGEFVATIDCKRWGKRKKLITYMTFADGRRGVAPTWPRSRYEGLAIMEVGSKIRVLYEENRSGTLCIRRAVLLAEPSEIISRSELIQLMEQRG